MPLSQLLKSSDSELKAELQLILNAVVEGLCGLDTEGNVTFCNEAFLKMTGYGAEEMIGSNFDELLHHPPPNGTQRAGQECAFRAAIKAGHAIHIVGEFHWRKDGSRFPAECWAHPFPRLPNWTTFVITLQDLSEIQQDKDAVRRSEEKFRRILASTPDVAWTSDRHGRKVYISPKVESIFGYTKREICTSGADLWLGRIHPEDSDRVKQAYEALFEEQSTFDQEYRIRRKDGAWIWVHDRATRTHEENGVLYADGILSDITPRKRAEAELQSQTAFLEAQTNSTIDGIMVVNGHNQRLLLNQRMVELFKIPPEVAANNNDQLLLEHVVTLVKDRESFLAKIDRLNRHPRETGRDEIELKDGMILDRYSSPVIGKNGVYYGRIWTFRDITERKRNEDTLQQLSAAVEQSPVSVVIADPQGNISYVNRKFTESTGYCPDEVVGKNSRMLNSGSSTSDSDGSLWSTITQGHEWRGEFCSKKKDGDIFWEAATVSPITNPNGAITHFLFVKEDITERKKTERELRLTQFSLANASDALFWVDPGARFVYANEAACRSLERSREELLSLSIPDIDPLLTKEVWGPFWKQCKERGSVTFESQNKSKQGRLFPVEVTANYLEFDGQEYIFAFVRDITERRTLEGQLRHAQKLEGIGQLAAGIAHEINTPTQFVTDNLTFLRDSWKSAHELLEMYRSAIRNAAALLPPGIAAALGQAERDCDLGFIVAEVPRAIDQSLDGSRRVAKIVRAMKEFSHPDSADKTAADLNRAIESTITVARNEWKYVAQIATEFDETLPPVVCYPGDINQVVLNLMVNAAHAVKDAVAEGQMGQITVRTRKRGEFAEISVTDTGTGIPEAIRSRIFDPFFTTKEVGKGTGQGLSLAHNVVVKKHSGKIWFETEIGRGTTFFVELPISPVEVAREN
jgi:two-component system, NtrC family, sensor kinase